MDDWNEGGFGMEDVASPPGRGKQASSKVAGAGGWHWVMTLVCFITVTALSFLMAWLTKDTVNRPLWIIGAIFTVPTFGMFAAALLVEKKTSAMTPDSSRRIQFLVALIAIFATFAVGCICDLIYQQKTMDQIIRNWAEAHPPEKVYSDIVLMVDKSSSLEENGKDQLNRKAIRDWLDGMDDKARVGMIVFNSSVLREVPIATLGSNRQLISDAVDVKTGSFTDFDVSLYHAFRMIDASENDRAPGLTTQIIAITDAEVELPEEMMEPLAAMAKEKNVAFSIVHLGQDVPASNPLMKLASATGGTGTSLGVDRLAQYFESIQNVEEPDWDAYYLELRDSGEVDFDLIRVSDPEANLICGVMLGLEGLAIGLCLMIMLSVTGQKRIQPLISVLMAAAAFVLLKILGPGVGPVEGSPKLDIPQWLLEGVSFSLLGIVFMKKNNQRSRPAGSGSGKSSGAVGNSGRAGESNPFPDGASDDSLW